MRSAVMRCLSMSLARVAARRRRLLRVIVEAARSESHLCVLVAFIDAWRNPRLLLLILLFLHFMITQAAIGIICGAKG